MRGAGTLASGSTPAPLVAGGPEHPWMVSAALLSGPGDPADRGPWRHIRRSGRDWAVDVLCVLVALMGAAAFVIGEAAAPEGRSEAVLLMDGALGLLGCAILWFRRRFPIGVGVVLALMSIVSIGAASPSSIALFTVAVHRRALPALAVAGLNVVAGTLFPLLAPDSMWVNAEGPSLWVDVALSVAICAATVAWGMFVRARRQLILSLHERAERAEATQRLLADQARLAERARIAREMHDVVAHRVSLVALHAGALELRPDLGPAEVARTAALVRTAARQALDELRGVIGVLRDGGSSAADAPDAPQPTLGDIARLVEDSRRAGARIGLVMDVAAQDASAAPGALGRDAYRIVQEALTNVNKHASGTVTTVTVTGAAGQGLEVVVRNRLPLDGAGAATLPGAGMGLVGLAERVALSSGTLEHGPTPDGDFLVRARLRWPG